jgi:predicted phosphate transport protein (TIGR00153 family)
MAWSLIPREEKFFTLFDRMAAKVVEGAKKFNELIENYTDVEDKAKRIKEIEHECDLIAHEVIDKLNKTFITPLEREDISSLVKYLDDVMDDIEATSSRFVMYGMKKPTAAVGELGRIIFSAAEQLQKAVNSIQEPQNLATFLVEINRLENQADLICREQIAKLFREEPDVREILKWKEVYEQLEACADRCEDVADVIEDIVVKNA